MISLTDVISDLRKSENNAGTHDKVDRCDFRTYESPKTAQVHMTSLTDVIFGLTKVRKQLKVHMTSLTDVIFGLTKVRKQLR